MLADKDAETDRLTVALSAGERERDALRGDLADQFARAEGLADEITRITTPVASTPPRLERAHRPRGAAAKGRVFAVVARLPVGWRNPLLDRPWYFAMNPDIRQKGADPQRHYRRHGAREGRNPNPLFNTKWYLAQNPDVRAKGMDPLDHYLRFGGREGRDPHPDFDSDWYLAQNPDVAASGMNPLLHYIRHGAAEGRDPSPRFDTRRFLAENPNATGSGMSPLAYSLLRRGRGPAAPTDRVTSEEEEWPPRPGGVAPRSAGDDGGVRSGMEGRPGVQRARGIRGRMPILGPRSTTWLRSLVPDPIPSGSRVLVMSGGEERWMRIPGVTTVPLPQGSDGSYPVVEPDSDTALIAQLEWGRASGAEFLVVPDQASGQLERFPHLRRHIEDRFASVARDPGTGTVRDLRTVTGSGPDPLDVLRSTMARFCDRSGRDPAILDLTAEHLAGRLQGAILVAADQTGPLAPWPDGSVDLVLADAVDPVAVLEAHRVALAAVVLVHDAESGGRGTVDWMGAEPPAHPTISIVITNFDSLLLLRACLASLRETLPAHEEIEVIVVDDASQDGSQDELGPLVASLPGARLLVNDANSGFLASANRGASTAVGDILVFLNNDTVLLPGWLEAILRTFQDHPDAGVVGGRLVYPDGRLQEAGGLVFRDGSAAKFGYGDPDPDAPEYLFLRDTDYVSGALLATPRELFVSLGGLDAMYGHGFYEDTDYCFRVRRAGRRVLYQPASVIIHIEGATLGTDTTVWPKRRQVENQLPFGARWADELARQPERPLTHRREDWYAAAVRPHARSSGRG